MDKDYTDLMKIIIFVGLFFLLFMFMACDSGWSVAGYEV
ncbi:hypothetical protein [uncultured Mediterranean phage uvMED]|jgi:hypothetical protein|nr:hypothetical protein [uncultured Mediterranean phage uvMED]